VAVVGTAADKHPKTVLLETQVSYLVECVQNGELDFARAHLEVVRAEFPREKRIITYYDGVIAFHRKDWKQAVEAFSKLPPREGEDDSDVLLYLFHAHHSLNNRSKAKAAVKHLEKTYGVSRESADARILLAQAIFGEEGGAPRAYALVADLAEKFPKHPQQCWLAYAAAEHQWNELQAVIVREKLQEKALSEVLAARAKKLADAYEKIRRQHPRSDEATASEFRAQALRRHLDR
jgi:hypothetical protein